MNGNCTFNGGATIQGSILTSGGMVFNGNSTVNIISAFKPPPDIETSTTADNVIITAWE